MYLQVYTIKRLEPCSCLITNFSNSFNFSYLQSLILKGKSKPWVNVVYCETPVSMLFNVQRQKYIVYTFFCQSALRLFFVGVMVLCL